MKTICFITSHITGNFNLPLVRHLVKKATEYQCNIIIYEGRIIDSSLSDYTKNQHILYNFIEPVDVDGIIISTGSMFYFSSQKLIKSFINRLNKTNLVSLFSKQKDVSNINTDNKTGIIKLIKHLNEIHNITKFVFVKGLSEGNDFLERYIGFIEGLKLIGISPEEATIFQGNQLISSGNKIIKTIIQEKLDIEAIIFSNDAMALGALEYIKKEQPGLIGKYAITGFDNISNSEFSTPTLTTVNQPVNKMIDKSLDLLLNDKISSDKHIDLIVPSEIVLRSSCGCEKKHANGDSRFNLGDPIYRALDNIRTFNIKELFKQLTQLLKQYQFKSCFISLFENPVVFDSPEAFLLPEYSYLKYEFHLGQEHIFHQEKKFLSKELLPKDIKLNEPYFLVVKPLYFNNEAFGAIMHDAQEGFEIEWENIRGIISNGIKGYNLIEEKNELVNDLNNALNQVKQLNGLLPICANCKKIRDDQGYWNRIEKYISENSEAEFTHSICPGCAKKLYNI